MVVTIPGHNSRLPTPIHRTRKTSSSRKWQPIGVIFPTEYDWFQAMFLQLLRCPWRVFALLRIRTTTDHIPCNHLALRCLIWWPSRQRHPAAKDPHTPYVRVRLGRWCGSFSYNNLDNRTRIVRRRRKCCSNVFCFVLWQAKEISLELFINGLDSRMTPVQVLHDRSVVTNDER